MPNQHTTSKPPQTSTTFWAKLKHWVASIFSSSDNEVIFSNAHATGTHKATLTKDVDNACAAYRVVTFGAREDSVKICTSNDVPFGATLNPTEAAGEPTTIVLLGVSGQTVRLKTSQDVAKGRLITVANDGTVVPLPESPEGHPWIVGLSLTTARANESVEVATNVPYKL